MSKLVILRLGDGSIEQGFSVTLQIGDDGARPTTEVTGKLPPNATLRECYQQWQTAYRGLGLSSRLHSKPNQVKNVSKRKDCDTAAAVLRDRFNQWLQAESFRPIREKWLEKLLPDAVVRVILQVDDALIPKLPWHLWDVLDRYPNAEIALSAPVYEQITRPATAAGAVAILAILGNSNGLDTQADRALLERLPGAHIRWLVEPQRQELTDRLWEQPWDVLFFAGHSEQAVDEGRIYINQTDSLSIAELRYGLRKALDRGLKLAIFNSCDGLGLARALADLHIPQIIVMREPVPDQVAQSFLKYFLEAFSQNEPLYLAVRQARERLQALEDQFPCATWLPLICQNPAETPPGWQGMQGQPKSAASLRWGLARVIGASILVTALLAGVRYFGGLQPIELQAFDQLQQLQPQEPIDPRLLVITIDDDTIRQQKRGRGSLADGLLSQLLTRLEASHPRAIGLDIYRDFPVEPGQPELAKQLKQNQKLISICKVSDPDSAATGVAPPPEIPVDRLGFSDFLEDSDGVLRRHLLFMNADPSSACTTPYAFSVQLAFRYLDAEGITPSFTTDGNLQLGKTVLPRLQPHTGGYQKIDARGGQILLRYRHAQRPIAQVSLNQFLTTPMNTSALKNRIIVIGVIARSAGDYWMTPAGKGPTEKVPGVLIQAEMVSQLLSAVLDQRSLLWVWPQSAEIAWIWLWSLMGGLLGWRIRSLRWLILATFTTIGMLGFLCFGLLIQGGWVPLVPPLLAIVGTLSAIRLYQTYRSQRLPTQFAQPLALHHQE